MRQLILVFSILLLSFSLFNSCKKDTFETSGFSLAFSDDTILFDTVFTSIGSSTQVFTVYNNSGNKIKIPSVRLATGDNSNFRLNVDGVAGKSFSNVEIGANDSIFIFVEVTVDPNNHNNPMVISDSILFTTSSGSLQYIDLVAWGQDAYFHRPSPNSHIAPFFFLNCNEIWDSLKPHVVYGYAMVDSGCTLTVNEGAKVYFHPGSGLIVLSSGTLIVNGTVQHNAVFQGDRLGVEFKDVPGQWDRIWLSNLNLHNNVISPGSHNSSIKYAVIKNGTIGLQVDTSYDNNPANLTLELENTIVKNMSSFGVAFRGSNVKAFNCVFANTGSNTTNLLYGGNYGFYHCTLANFWNNKPRQDAVLNINNYTPTSVRPLNAYFGNCIIYGDIESSNGNELAFDTVGAGNQLNFTFDHCLMKLENSFPTSNTSRYISIVKAPGSSNDPKFTDIENNYYELDSASSAAINKGDMTITQTNSILTNDILGVSRVTFAPPDLGAYERR